MDEIAGFPGLLVVVIGPSLDGNDSNTHSRLIARRLQHVCVYLMERIPSIHEKKN